MRRWVSVCLLIALLLLPRAANAHHGSCFYDPDSMVGFGCTPVDYQMIDVMTRMQLAANQSDYDTFYDLLGQAIDLEDRYGGVRLGTSDSTQDYLHISPWNGLRHYQVIDSAEAGANIRYATVQGENGRPQLIFWDRLGRPMKIAGMNYTSKAERWIDIALAFVWGAVGSGGWVTGSLTKAVTMGKVVVPATTAAVGDGVINLGLSLAVGIPDADSTQVLVDVLHTQDDGTQVVYRNRVVVSSEGQIDVRQRSGQTWWKLDGVVRYDRDGQPVW